MRSRHTVDNHGLAPFPCDKCGLCCESLAGNPLYRDLDDGTGICRYFDRSTRLCTIYERRPLKCNTAASYKWFADKMTYEEFVQQNLAVCQQLKTAKRKHSR